MRENKSNETGDAFLQCVKCASLQLVLPVILNTCRCNDTGGVRDLRRALMRSRATMEAVAGLMGAGVMGEGGASEATGGTSEEAKVGCVECVTVRIGILWQSELLNTAKCI